MHSCPAIAAYVTSYARELLYGMIQTVGLDHVYYVDTDSLHVDNVGKDLLTQAELIRPGEIGYLKHVGTWQTAEYRGLKDYTLGDMHVIAGIKHRAVEMKHGVFEQTQFQRLRSILAGPVPQGVRVDTVTVDRSHNATPCKLDASGRIETPILSE